MRLTLLHKIIINNIAITTADLGMAAGDGRTKSNHARKLRAMGAQTPQLKESFAVRTIPESETLGTGYRLPQPRQLRQQPSRLSWRAYRPTSGRPGRRRILLPSARYAVGCRLTGLTNIDLAIDKPALRRTAEYTTRLD